MKTRFGVFTIMIFLAASASGEEISTTLEEQVAAITRMAQTPVGEMAVIQRLSEELRIPIGMLLDQRDQTKLDWGELLIANRLAQKTGLTLEEVVGEFESGKSWRVIAAERQVHLGELVSQVRETREAIEGEAEKVRTNSATPQMKTKGPRQKSGGRGHDGMGGRGRGWHGSSSKR